MKHVSKMLIALLFSLSFICNAMAGEPVYGSPKSEIKPGSKDSTVFLINKTPETYMSRSTYRDSGRVYYNHVSYAGDYPYDTIVYPINFPDYAVCLYITRDATGQPIPGPGCVSSGTYYIRYMEGNKVEITKE